MPSARAGDASVGEPRSVQPVAFEETHPASIQPPQVEIIDAEVEVAEPRPIQEMPAPRNGSSEPNYDLETLIGMALVANPAVEQAEAAVAQATGVHHQAGLKPNPTVGYFGQEIGNGGAGGQHGVFASQTIVRGDKLQWNRCVTLHDINRLRWDAESQRRRVETDVRIRFYRALAAQEQLKQARAFRNDAVEAVKVAKTRLEAAEGTRPDVLQSQLLVDQIDLSIRQSELKWQAAWQELAATIGQPSLAVATLYGEFAAADASSAESLFEQVASDNPLLNAARVRVDRARTNLQRQRNQAIPNLNAQVGVGYDDSNNNTFANVQLAFPVPYRNRNQGNISAAQAEYVAASQNFQRLSLRLRRDLAGVQQRLQAAAVAVAKYEETMLPRAQESLELVEKAYIAGEISFLRVLTARQTVFQLQQSRLIAKGELSQAHAEIQGKLLTNALGSEVVFEGDDGLRGQALSGQ